MKLEGLLSTLEYRIRIQNSISKEDDLKLNPAQISTQAEGKS